ncbi:MAG: hydrogenase expression/formation protein HypE [Nitrospirota bacterium]
MTMDMTCPLPLSDYPNVLLAHGGGGRLTQQMIRELFLPRFANEFLTPLHDGAIVPLNGAKLALTTDAYVVSPIVFPGGDIGRLAVNGTINDLAMCGARPLYLSAALIIEEGLPMALLRRVADSMQAAAASAGVLLVAGDTKVVDRGKGDQLFITTSGVGLIEPGVEIDPRRAARGDRIILSGPIGQHGMAIMSVREGLEFESPIESDTAPLHGLTASMLAAGDVHVLRDPTRGGVAGALNEIAASAGVGMEIDERRIPVPEAVEGACELLGLDPLYVANEGRLIAIVPPENADAVLAAMQAHPLGAGAVNIGEVMADHPGVVTMRTSIGGCRVVDLLSGEQLPRIC